MDLNELSAFASKYADAWSGQNAASLAACYAADGSLTVNDGPPAQGREAIAQVAQGYMTAFPDMEVALDRIVPHTTGAVFHWTLTGTNTGPGGTGQPVRISGYEEWTFTPDGLIAQSLGHFDADEYARQLAHGVNG